MLSTDERDWDSKCFAKIAWHLSQQNFGSETIQLPDLRNIMHILRKTRLWFWYGKQEYRRKELPDFVAERTTATT